MKKETYATATVLAKRGLAAGCAKALRSASPLPVGKAMPGDAIKRVKGHATLRFTEAQVVAIRRSSPE
jgi:hypothetical protein